MQRRITDKQKVWMERYLANGFNATEAADYAGYTHPNKRGPENVVKRGLREAIEARLYEMTMSANEVLARIAMFARREDPTVALRALDLLAKHHGLLVNRVELSWQDEFRANGLDPSEVFEQMVAGIIADMTRKKNERN